MNGGVTARAASPSGVEAYWNAPPSIKTPAADFKLCSIRPTPIHSGQETLQYWGPPKTQMNPNVAVSLLSFGPRLVMNSHRWKYGKWSTDKESIDSVTKAETNETSRFSGGHSVRLGRETLFCHQVGQIWSCRAAIFSRIFSARSSDGHGFKACSSKNKRKT